MNKKIFSKQTWIVFTVISILCTVSVVAQGGFFGAIYTTLGDGQTVNQNVYESKDHVYLNGGPQNAQSQGLPDGTYYFQVTDPSGKTLLSEDDAVCRQVEVVDGRMAGASDASGACAHADATANDANGSIGVQLMPYADTPNNGGEYKVWLIRQTASTSIDPNDPRVIIFASRDAKTDNFKVRTSSPDDDDEGVYTLRGCKFYDANANGVWDDGEVEIPGFKIIVTLSPGDEDNEEVITVFTGEDGCWEVTDVAENTEYLIEEVLPLGNWAQTYPEEIPVDDGEGGTVLRRVHVGFAFDPDCDTDPCVIDDLDFGNYCFSPVEGNTLGYWSNKNGLARIDSGEADALNAFCLRNQAGDDSDFAFPGDFANKGVFSKWLLDGNAQNMAYMLSVQMAATYLNIANGDTPGDAVIFVNGEFVVLNDLIDEANDLLCANAVVTESGDLRDEMERLKNIFDAVNNDEGIIIHETPCDVVYPNEEGSSDECTNPDGGPTCG